MKAMKSNKPINESNKSLESYNGMETYIKGNTSIELECKC